MYKRVSHSFNKKAPNSGKIELTCVGCDVKFMVFRVVADQGRKYHSRECYYRHVGFKIVDIKNR